MPTPQEILDELRKVKYPGFTRDIVSFGMVRDIEIGSRGITVTLAVTAQKPDVVAEIRERVTEAVRNFSGSEVEIVIEAPEPPQRRAAGGPQGIPGIRHVVAVASGKGGVGKSTVATNLALALHALGHRVGLLDADVYGPSVPLMLGTKERPAMTDDNRIIPIDRYGIKVISMGMFVGEAIPIIWRGPMINKLLTQFLRDVEWGELDYLVLDLPPGTGDAQLTIAQQVPLSGGLIVTTPQDVALLDVKRGITMFQQVNAPVLGVVENMSFHVCPRCGDRADLFGHGGGQAMAAQFDIPFLGDIPLVREIREAGDAGTPIVTAQPAHAQSQAFLAVARRLVEEVAARSREELPTIH